MLFTATPAADYQVAAWIINGEAVPGETGLTYTHENLNEDIHVEVIFGERVAGLILRLDEPILYH